MVRRLPGTVAAEGQTGFVTMLCQPETSAIKAAVNVCNAAARSLTA